MFKRIGLVAKPGDVRAREALRPLLDHLALRGIEVSVDRHAAALLENGQDHPEFTGAERVDLVIAVGGDGTLLRAAHSVADPEVRLLGVNAGHLGFLTDISPDEIPERLDAILAGQYIEEPRMVLDSTVLRAGQVIERRAAINDVIVQKWNIARLITLDTYVDERFVHRQRSDGIIVATPTGSTAYALSCGGPILHPALEAIALVPLCPHALTNRPIVLPAASSIEIVVETREADQARLTCDGDPRCELAPGDRVRISKRPCGIHLIHPLGHDHFATLRAKLLWS
ncbi:MAG: NAD(+) kinase [Gammaproteobacteria bacterium]